MRFIPFFVAIVLLASCSKGITKILKSPDPEYKLRMAEKYFVDKKYTKAQALYEDVVPYYKTRPEFQDIYYKMAYCAYNQADYLNAENLFKTFGELFPNSPKTEEVEYMRAFSYYKQSPKPELDQTNTIKTIGMMQVFLNTHPGSERSKEAGTIIEECRAKLETKDYKGAKLYFDMGQFRAAGVAFSTLLNNYPESNKADEYKLMVIRAYYRFAEMSVDTRKQERYEQVIDQVDEFVDRFPESKFRKDVENFRNLSQTNIKNLRNEQVKTSA